MLCLLASGWLLSSCPKLAAAQQMRRERTPREIVLPPKIVAGEPATLAVIDEGSRLLPGVTVGLTGGQEVTTDSTGRALFIAPSAAGAFFAKIPHTRISASSICVAGEEGAAATSSTGGPGALKLSSYPHVLAVRDRFAISGSGFLGAADSNRVVLGGGQCLVIAASPVSLVILPGPRVPIGTISLHLTVRGGDEKSFPVTSVLLDFSGPAEAPAAGADGKLILHVHGTTEPLAVEVHNASPQIIQLLHGNLQRLGTSGGEENIAPVELKYLAAGDYVIS
ncbi:MAG: IPT/TIG domain-containing protein, partial [Candidatus Acidiferrales bacterium]